MLDKLATGLIEVYQKYLRHTLPLSCRFYPTCSEYSREAIMKYGFWQGGIKGLRRIFRCHPFSRRSGHDPLS